MQAQLQSIDLSSTTPFEDFIPEDVADFSVWATMHVGTPEVPGAELFQLEICTPRFLARRISSIGPEWGRHKLIVERYDARILRSAIERYLETCVGKDWNEVSAKIARIAAWEFEDYRP